jgi:hypothetical protein
MSLYLVSSSVMLLFLGIIWGRAEGRNLLIKLILLGTGGYGIFVTLQQFGFVLHK